MTSLSHPTGAPMEVEPGSHPGPPRRQISNISIPYKKSGIAGSSSNLVNSIVGAGIIGVPYALKESGLVAGVLLLVIVSYFTDKSLRMIVEMASFHPRLKGHGVLTYEDLMMMPFGIMGHHFILGSMLITSYGAMIAYLLIVKDTLPVVLGLEEIPGEGSFAEREFVMFITSVVIMLPLSMFRDLSTLSWTSFVSVFCDVLLVLFILMFSPIRETVGDAGGLGDVLKEQAVNPGFFIGFGVLTLAMMCQHYAFLVAGSLSNLTTTRWAAVTKSSVTISFFLCAVLGIAGYLGFLSETKGDVLNNFDPTSLEATVARGLLAATMFLTYPMESFVARHVLIKFMFNGDMDGLTTDPTTGELVKGPKILKIFERRHIWALVIYIVTLIPALLVKDLGPVLSYTGAIGGSALAYIGPGLAYLGVHGEAFLAWLSHVVDGTPNELSGGTSDSNDLPLEGDAQANMEDVVITTPLAGPKPWWWFPTLMPIWVMIAKKGSAGMNQRLAEFGVNRAPLPTGEPPVGYEVVPFRQRDAWFSIFFIVFGTVTLVAGILSNLYVQVHEFWLAH